MVSLQRDSLELNDQNKIKQKESKTNEFTHSFKEKCISGCLLILFTVGPMFTSIKSVEAQSNSNYNRQITSSQTLSVKTPQISYSISGPLVKVKWGADDAANKFIISIFDITGNKLTKDNVNLDKGSTGYNFVGIYGHEYKVTVQSFKDEYNNKENQINISVPNKSSDNNQESTKQKSKADMPLSNSSSGGLR